MSPTIKDHLYLGYEFSPFTWPGQRNIPNNWLYISFNSLQVVSVLIWRFVFRWLTTNDPFAPNDPCLFCERCFRMLHYDKKGNKLGQFLAYPYVDPGAFNWAGPMLLTFLPSTAVQYWHIGNLFLLALKHFIYSSICLGIHDHMEMLINKAFFCCSHLEL